MLEKIKKHDNFIVCIFFIIVNIIFVHSQLLTVGDELWNFQNVYKMINGYQIYKDANVIITPIFFIIAKIILQIFGSNILVFRIYHIAIFSIMILLIYQIFKTLNITKRMAFLYTLSLYYVILELIQSGANYNILAELFALVGILIFVKCFGEKKFNILNAIIIYMVLFTKQNIGVYYFIASTILQIVLLKNKKDAIINIIKQGLIVTLLVITTFIIFYINGNLLDFINYAFLGMGEFARENVGIEPINMLYLIVALITIIGSIICIRYINSEEQKRNILILLIFSIFLMLIIYPIINMYHILIGMITFIILLIYLVHITILTAFQNKKNIINIAILIISSIIILLGIKNVIVVNSYDIVRGEKNTPYFGALLYRKQYNNIEIVNNYISEQNEKAVIFSGDAALYNIPKKRTYGAMDLPFLGNMGKNGEEEMIKKITNMVGYKILIKEPILWQESEKIINFIKENYEKIGEINDFQIYEIK